MTTTGLSTPQRSASMVPKSGPRGGRIPKRRRDEPAAATPPPTRTRRPRRAVHFDGFELDDDDDEGLQLEPDDDGSD